MATLVMLLTALTLLNVQGSLGAFDPHLRCKCGPGNWVKVGSVNPLDTCPTGFTSTNIGGAQVCWKKSVGCTGFSFTSEQSYSAVCGFAEGYNYGSPDGFGLRHDAIDEAYVDGLSITHGTPRQHLFSYASAWRIEGCPCKGGRGPPDFVGDNYYCGDDVEPASGDWEKRWFPDTIIWHAATDCSDIDIACRNDARPWFSVETVGGSTSDDVEVRSCQDQAYDDEAIGIANLEIYVRVD